MVYSRVPGPAGLTSSTGAIGGGAGSNSPTVPSGRGGALPGPLGRTLWQKQSTASGTGATAQPAKTLLMPPPTADKDDRDLHEVKWPLYNPDTKAPAYEDIVQAPNLANCPVPSILAALAFTRVGRDQITGMLSEKAASVVTDISNAGKLANPPGGTTINSSRYFTVKLRSGVVEVSDVLYTNDSARDTWSIFYLRDPTKKSIWASIIEKAIAHEVKSYENIDALNISANAFWEKIMGVLPDGFSVQDDTPLKKIIDAAQASPRVPTIGASKAEETAVQHVSPFHGYAMLGMQGSRIVLFDAAADPTLDKPKPRKILLTPEQFRHDFQAVFYPR
jgi:hypothetical protein